MDNKAITAGVRTGGLTDRTEIKILLCYLLASLKQPITQNQLIECVCGQELVNYFEMQSALQHLLDNRLIKEDEQGFSILPEGAEIAQQLESAVNTTVKRYAYTMAVNLLQYEALKKQNKTEIIPLEDGGYELKCSIEDSDFSLFSMTVRMPDEKSAKLAGEQFVMKGQDIFRVMLGITTETPALYRDFVKEHKYD
ncbi:MAG: DUF4364 family protein [Oscillospiraceae bacterium]|nr:DUF4364 family protein [Oscillospiraceae bacterium]